MTTPWKSERCLCLPLTAILILAMMMGGCSRTGGSPADSAVAAPPQAAAAAPSDPAAGGVAAELSRAFEQAAAKVGPSVVPIFAEQVVQTAGTSGFPDEALRDFFGPDFSQRFFGQPAPQKKIQRSLGSGVIITADGLILTNNHVVAGADKLTVVVGEKKTYVAKTIGTDPQSDVAVVRIEAQGLPAAALGNSDDVRVGEWVIAVGNPFELMHTVTAGIISAAGRSDVGLAAYEDFFQTDASINPGNSGGALADLNGKVIGINTAIASPSGGNIGIGFAIPINMAKAIKDQLVAKGRVIRGYLGLTPQDIDEDLAKAMKLKDTSGALISDVARGGPADKAGIKSGDVIVRFNGTAVEDSTALRKLAAQAAPGSTAVLSVIRDGRNLEIKASLAERPKAPGEKEPARSEAPEPRPSERLGLAVQTLTPDIAQQLGYDKSETGVVVADTASAGAADRAGLQRGDVIKEVDRKAVKTAEEFEREIRKYKKGDTLALLVKRGPASSYIPLTID